MASSSARNGRKSNGAKTTVGKLKIALSNVSHGIWARLPVLKGLEDPEECARFHQGFFEVWQPIGQQEQECVEHLAHCYWRLRRAKRHETELIPVKMLQASDDDLLFHKPESLESYVQDILDGNGQSKDGSESASWWQKIVEGSDELSISVQEASALLECVIEEMLEPDEDEDSDEEGQEPGARSFFQVPSHPITLGELRAQLKEMAQLGGPSKLDPFDVIQQRYERALSREESRKEAQEQARRLVITYLLGDTVTLPTYRRQIHGEIRHYMNILRTLQSLRQGEPLPSPVAVDINLSNSATSP